MRALCASLCIALATVSATAADFELEFTEQTLNRLLTHLGNPSDGGLYQPNTALTALGLSGCTPVGVLDCASGTSGLSTTSPQFGISVCQGPDGQTTLAPTVESIPWQWWITDARFTVAAQQLTFSATVRYRIGRKWFSVTQTVPAALTADLGNQRFRMDVSAFKVPIRYTASGVVETLAEVDVSRHMSFTKAIAPKTISAHDLAGQSKTLTGNVSSASVQYLPGTIVVRVDGGLN